MTIVPHNTVTSSSDCTHEQKSSIENPWRGMRFIVHPITRDEFHAYRIEEGEILTKIEDFDQHITNAKDPHIAILDRIIEAAIKKREQLK